VRRVNDESVTLVEYPPLGKTWLKAFYGRHPQCQTVLAKPIEKARIEGTTPEILQKWFDAYQQEVVEDPDVRESNVYNMDESGFSIGAIKAGKVVVDKQVRTRYQAEPGRQEWVTVIECICGDGTSISPYIIFKGMDINRKWVPENVPHTWRIGVGANGWTSQKHAMEWMREVFEPETRSKAGTFLRTNSLTRDKLPRVLICDGHDSHVTGDVIEHCMENNIKLLILPPHSSHFTQPLDIGIFSPLEEYMTQETLHLIRPKSQLFKKWNGWKLTSKQG